MHLQHASAAKREEHGCTAPYSRFMFTSTWYGFNPGTTVSALHASNKTRSDLYRPACSPPGHSPQNNAAPSHVRTQTRSGRFICSLHKVIHCTLHGKHAGSSVRVVAPMAVAPRREVVVARCRRDENVHLALDRRHSLQPVMGQVFLLSTGVEDERTAIVLIQ